MTNLEKEAQSRSITRGIGRFLNPMEKARRWSSKDYRKIYDAISKVDNKMRDKAKKAKPGTRDAIHEARIAMKRREFPKVVYYTMKVIDSVNGVFEQVSDLNSIREEMFKRYYGGKTELKDTQLQEMHRELGQKPKDQKTEKQVQSHLNSLLYVKAVPDPALFTKESFDKEGGPLQWMQEHMPSMKGMKFDLIDRLFANKADKQRNAAQESLDIAEESFEKIEEIFDELDENLGNFSEYVRIANEAKNSMAKNKERLSALYQANFADIVPGMAQHNEPAAEPEQEAAERELQEKAKVPEEKSEDKAEPEAPPAEPEADKPMAKMCPNQQCSQLNEADAEKCKDCGTSLAEVAATEVDKPPSGVAATQPMEAVPEAGEIPDLFEQAPDSGEGMSLVEPVGQTEEELQAAYGATNVVKLVKRAERAYNKGDKGVASALLVKASEICDDNGAVEQSITLLQAADRVLSGAAIEKAAKVVLSTDYSAERAFIGAVKDALEGGYDAIDKLDEEGGNALRGLAKSFLGKRKPDHQFDDAFDEKLKLTNAVLEGMNNVLVPLDEAEQERGLIELRQAVAAFEEAIKD